uniref:Transmembrane protein n=1 Tax=Bursaphelenchus xylophilus TaxID=6326 RepID=A0A1I7RIZ1_BURXY
MFLGRNAALDSVGLPLLRHRCPFDGCVSNAPHLGRKTAGKKSGRILGAHCWKSRSRTQPGLGGRLGFCKTLFCELPRPHRPPRDVGAARPRGSMSGGCRWCGRDKESCHTTTNKPPTKMPSFFFLLCFFGRPPSTTDGGRRARPVLKKRAKCSVPLIAPIPTQRPGRGRCPPPSGERVLACRSPRFFSGFFAERGLFRFSLPLVASPGPENSSTAHSPIALGFSSFPSHPPVQLHLRAGKVRHSPPSRWSTKKKKNSEKGSFRGRAPHLQDPPQTSPQRSQVVDDKFAAIDNVHVSPLGKGVR